MAYDMNQSKQVLEAGPVAFPIWLLQNTEVFRWEDTAFSIMDWISQNTERILADWETGDQFEPMMPQGGSGGGDTVGAYNNGFNNGFIVGLRLKRR